MNQEDIVFEKKGAVAYMTINRETLHNALNMRILEKMEKIFLNLEEDPEVVVVIITGAGGKAFVAGADVKEIKEAGDKRTALINRGQEILSKIRNSSKVVIAAVNGYALGGGCELAMSCDIRIASENAKFGLPEAKLGLMPGYGGTQNLPRLVGIGMAKYILFASQMLTSDEALQCGLVQKICKSENLMDEADSLAKQICLNGPFAVRACKRAINNGIGLSIEDALKLEIEIYDKVGGSMDAEEGMSSFLEKRTPIFKGR